MSETNSQPGSELQLVVPKPEQLPHIVKWLSKFTDFAANHALFVDKTALLQKLVDQKFVFLSRPRRFGKSLLISMLKELFEHGTKNFEGLDIHDLWCEKTYPVLTLSFLDKNNPDTFEADLCTALRDAFYEAGFHEVYDFIPECNNFKVLSGRLVRQVLKGQQVVLLIDEWDDPLSSNLNQRDNFEKITVLLRHFYTWIRESNAFWFVLVTGIGRYQNTSFFTGEFITDISMEPYFAALVGYTQEELERYFAPYIVRCAWLKHISQEEMLEQIKLYYDGFCFDRDGLVKVYSPWSINCFFSQVELYPDCIPSFDSFWMDNANAPSAIRTYLKLHQPNLTFLEQVKSTGIKLSESFIKATNTFDDMPFLRLMINTGYLTIKEKLPPNQDKPNFRNYRCNFTNIEVEELYAEVILSYLTGSKGALVDESVKDYAAMLVSALRSHDMPTAVNAINTMLSVIHYELWQGKDREALYRLLIAFFLQIETNPRLIRQEVPNNVGRSDIEALLGNDLFVFELKLLHNKPRTKNQEQAAANEAADVVANAAANVAANAEPAPTEPAQNSAQGATNTPDTKSTNTLIENNPVSLARQISLSAKALEQMIGRRYGSGSFSRIVEKCYGVVLIISEADRQVCYWRHFTTNQDLGSGAAEPINLNNPPRVVAADNVGPTADDLLRG